MSGPALTDAGRRGLGEEIKSERNRAEFTLKFYYRLL
jgi:hypothetical protein